jgi:hypothetical protein
VALSKLVPSNAGKYGRDLVWSFAKVDPRDDARVIGHDSNPQDTRVLASMQKPFGNRRERDTNPQEERINHPHT